MKTYAFIQNGEIVEIIPPVEGPDGVGIDINDRFAPAFVSDMVDITNLNPPPGLHWTYEDGVFQAPKPFPVEN